MGLTFVEALLLSTNKKKRKIRFLISVPGTRPNACTSKRLKLNWIKKVIHRNFLNFSPKFSDPMYMLSLNLGLRRSSVGNIEFTKS